MMKKGIMFLLFFSISFFFAQDVILNKVEKLGTNKDKFLYKINPDSVKADYLGEIEVQGYSKDDVSVFDMIYKKAKNIGANAFAYKPIKSIDGTFAKFDSSHYLLSLYDVPKGGFPDQSNLLYIISSSDKAQKISFDDEKLELAPRSFYLRNILAGESYLLSTRKFLGSSVKIQSNKTEGKQFFQISAFKINANAYGEAGINIKSGDIFKLEKSYGDFITTIYTKNE